MNNYTNFLIDTQYKKKLRSINNKKLKNITFKEFLKLLNLKSKIKQHYFLIDNKILNNYTFNKWIKNNINNDKTTTNFSVFTNIEVIPKIKGGFIMELINAVLNLLKIVINIPKLFIFIGNLIWWLINTLKFIIELFINVIDINNIVGLLVFVTNEILLVPFKFAGIIIKKVFNNIGNMSVVALSGADNVKGAEEEEPTQFHTTTASKEKCYRTSDGLVPFSVIIATILCPPIGVFMEYGVFGWLNILICALLTLVFYFPGLIYALILLYC